MAISSGIVWEVVLVLLFAFKFVKVLAHLISFFLYQPFPIPRRPTVEASDVTVIIPTVGDFDGDFEDCLLSIIINRPAKIIVATVGIEKHRLASLVCENLSPIIEVWALLEPNKRRQIYAGIRQTATKITVLADDHVLWSPSFLATALAPFENPRVGGVATLKRVIRDYPYEFTWSNFCNFIACTYLERQNFEWTATSNIDGGFGVISGLTALYRTDILRSPDFVEEYLNETCAMGFVGPMNDDDDHCITRYLVNKGWNIYLKNSEDATILTTLGDPEKLFKQLNQWSRSTWRSNSTSLFSDFTVWQSQPWCVYAIYLSSFVNFALFYDALLFYSLYRVMDDPSPFIEHSELTKSQALGSLAAVLFDSKIIKPYPHFWRNFGDLRYIVFYIMFGYYHSFIKLWAFLTVLDISGDSTVEVD
ncbi:hypothetical protein MMC18_006077 [Xylographa bjoerkii]|nr:hypothetical protein [Xylographa bjoerkii]